MWKQVIVMGLVLGLLAGMAESAERSKPRGHKSTPRKRVSNRKPKTTFRSIPEFLRYADNNASKTGRGGVRKTHRYSERNKNQKHIEGMQSGIAVDYNGTAIYEKNTYNEAVTKAANRWFSEFRKHRQATEEMMKATSRPVTTQSAIVVGKLPTGSNEELQKRVTLHSFTR